VHLCVEFAEGTRRGTACAKRRRRTEPPETPARAGRKCRVTHTLRFRASVYEGNLRQPAHAHDQLQISLVLSGRLRETVRGAVSTAGALSVVVKDSGIVHDDQFGPERVTIAQLSLSGGTLRDLIDTAGRAPVWFWSHTTTLARPLLRIVTRAGLGASSFASDDTDIIDLLAMITARDSGEPHGAPPRWLSAAVEELRDTWTAGTRVKDVAARVGVHPVYLARCFRRWYGHGVSDDLRVLRQRAAVDAIVTGTATFSTIAHDAGYADEPHLNREFRALCGTTPGRFRRAFGNLDVPPPTSGRAPADELRGYKSGRV